MDSLQLAKQLNQQQPLDGQMGRECKSIGDYAKLYQQMMAQQGSMCAACQGQGENCQICNGTGIKGNGTGLGMGDSGRGRGNVAPEDPTTKTDFRPDKSTSKMRQGKILLKWKTEVEAPDGEARIEWSATSDGKFEIELRDLRFGSRGGSDFLYRMTLEESALGFSLHSGAAAINLMQDKDATLTLRVKRTGGFQGPIDLALEGLPKGVTFTPKQIAAKANTTKLVFKATTDVASRGYPLSISGTANIDGKTVSSRLASRHLGVDGEGLSADSPDDDRFLLTVCHKPGFRLFCNEAYMYAHRGTVYQYAMEVERLDGCCARRASGID